MGLDINVYRPRHKSKTDNIDNWEVYHFLLEEHPELDAFKQFAVTEELEYFNFEKAFKDLNLNIDDYDEGGASYSETCEFYYHHKETKELLTIIDPSTIKVKKELIYADEIGYQRKGANTQFYDDGMWDADCILDLKTLKQHHKKYFSTDLDCKKNFKTNIIDKFIEGETFVIYH